MRKSSHFMTEIDKYCSKCRDFADHLLCSKEERIKIKDTFVQYTAQGYKCTKCDNFFVPADLENINFNKAYSLYRKAHNLLSVDEIKKIRVRYGLSQKDFSKLLAWGEITIHRYEAGAIQDQAHNQVLEFVSDPQNALKLFSKNRQNLTKSVATKLEECLLHLVGEKQQFSKASKFPFGVPSPKDLLMARQAPSWGFCHALQGQI